MSLINLNELQAGDLPYPNLNSACAECGKKIEGQAVRYDLRLENSTGSILLHPTCAVLVGKRLIADGHSATH